MKKFTVIGTWRMAYAGMQNAIEKKSKTLDDFVLNAITSIEDYSKFKSVGRGGLPNIAGFVQVDAGYMNGKDKSYGAIMGMSGIANPILLAKMLSGNKYNRMLSGKGAEDFAKKNGFKFHKLETEWSTKKWEEKLKKIEENKDLSSYDGHDTVCFVGTDYDQQMIAATSTSGLFMKEVGRVGDSPLIGSGFYADINLGSAAATGLGEDIAKGVLSYKTTLFMGDGYNAMEASNKALFEFINDMKSRRIKVGPISIVATDKNGNWGVATNCLFQFSVLTEKDNQPTLYIANISNNGKNTDIVKAEDGYWEEYIQSLENR